MRTGNRDRGPGTQRRARERRAKECDAGTGRRRGEPLHPRNVVGFVALFVALGGGAYATHTHKMGTKDLKRAR